jgi:flagellar biosynthesis protein FlhA
VPIRNLRAIVETLAEHAPRTQDPAAAARPQVRVALGRQIVQDIAGLRDELPVITLEPELEQLLSDSLPAQWRRRPGSSRASPNACRRSPKRAQRRR